MRLSVAQAAALQRAVLVARREDLVTRLGLPADVPAAAPTAEVRVAEYAEVLDEVMAALKHRGRLHCRYNGKERLVDPQVLEPKYGDWYLRVLEDDAEPDPKNLKTFLVSRMSETRMVDPGHGRRVEGGRHVALHPLGFETDPPVEVVLRTAPGYRADVVRWMREPAGEEERAGSGRDALSSHEPVGIPTPALRARDPCRAAGTARVPRRAPRRAHRLRRGRQA